MLKACGFMVNSLMCKKCTPQISTLYSQNNSKRFQWVNHIFHKCKNGYLSQALYFFPHQTVDLSAIFYKQAMDRSKRVIQIFNPISFHSFEWKKGVYIERTVNNLVKWLCVTVDCFLHSQKMHFRPLICTQSIHICLHYSFHGLALL